MADPMEKQPHLWDYRWVRDLMVILVIVLILWLLYTIRAVGAPIILGLGMAYVFNPVVTWAHVRIKWPRVLTTSVIMLVGLSILCCGILITTPPLIAQSKGVINTLRTFAEEKWVDVAPRFNLLSGNAKAITDFVVGEDTEINDPPTEEAVDDEKPAEVAEVAQIETEQEQPADESQAEEKSQGAPEPLLMIVDELAKLNWTAVGRITAKSLGAGVGAVGSLINTTSYLVLAAVITAFCFFFFSWNFGPIIDWFKPLIPKSERERTFEIIRMMDRTVAAFIRGRLIQALVMGFVLSIGWWIAGVPYWLLLGMLCGFLNLIPYAASLGWILAVVLTVIYNLTGDTGFTVMAIVWPTVVYFIAQLLDGWVVEPFVQGQATDLDPLTVLLVVIIGGALAGLLGMLLAIPLAACVKILGREVIIPRLREFADSR